MFALGALLHRCRIKWIIACGRALRVVCSAVQRRIARRDIAAQIYVEQRVDVDHRPVWVMLTESLSGSGLSFCMP